MARVPSGTVYSVASTIAATKTTTVASNATEAVITSVAHGYANGDYVLMTSGWARMNNRAFRIKSVAADTFALEGFDTTNTNLFPAGSGVGTVAKVTTWTQLSQVMNPNSSGGDPKQVEYKYLESDVGGTINDGFSPVNRTIELDADAIGTPGYSALKTLTQVQTNTVVLTSFKSGAKSLLPCTVTLNEEEIISDGQIIKVKATFSGNNITTRYAT